MSTKKRVIWVWYTKELLLENDKKESFFDFCKRKNIGELFFQLQLSYHKNDAQKETYNIEYQEEMHRFINEAHSRGIKVHGLDGHPTFALKENHPKVLSIVQTILNFNKSSAPDEKLHGVHFDNEPYLLPDFKKRRKIILFEFLEINKRCADAIQSVADEIMYGVDVPYWLAGSPETISIVGEDKPLGFHLIDMCDNIGVMDYRNFATGPDGMIEHGLKWLEYADTEEKNIYIGVETYENPDEKTTESHNRISFAGMSEKQFENELNKAEKAFSKYSSFQGFAIHSYRSYRKLCGE